MKLGFILAEKIFDQFKEGVMEEEALHLMTQGFAKLTHIKVFTFALEEITYVESWLVVYIDVILGVKSILKSSVQFTNCLIHDCSKHKINH